MTLKSPALSYLRPVVAFDVDNTLINSDGTPRKNVIQLFILLQRFGCQMVIWSNGGGETETHIEYATRIAKQLELDALILEKGSIVPDITVDDLGMHDRLSEGTVGRVNIQV